MVRDVTELRRHLREAFEAVLRERLDRLAPDDRDAAARRLRDAFTLALEGTPPRADAVGDMQIRALLATVVELVLGSGSRDDDAAEPTT